MGIDRLGEKLLAHFRESVAVAYSGGADSALVLAAAARALGPGDVLAVTAVSGSYPSTELAPASEFARGLGVRHELARTQEMQVAGYRANGTNRCYFCKTELIDVITVIAREHGIARIATGTNADDARDPFRPGIRAGDERNVDTPLRDLGFTKADVRALSRAWQLPTWAKPASPCLASRIRHGVEVTPFRLSRVDRAEAAARTALSARGLASRDLRVRDLGDAARVEIDADLTLDDQAAADVRIAVAATGFDGEVTLAPFSSGALSREAAQRRRV